MASKANKARAARRQTAAERQLSGQMYNQFDRLATKGEW